MPLDRADAHIHLFPDGYQGEFTGRPGVRVDEAACYASLARDYSVAVALVVGYAREPWCDENNAFIAEMAARHSWVRPVAFVHAERPLTREVLERLNGQRFVGVSFYVFTDAEAAALESVADEVWAWLERRRWLISANSRGHRWRTWRPILQRHNNLRVLVSHLGLPTKFAQAPTATEARTALADVLPLAAFPQVHVKYSGFYAATTVPYGYPYQAAWPTAEELFRAFGPQRLLWGSDFSPCLDSMTFPQTLGVIDALPFLNDDDRRAIVGGNLLGLLASMETHS